MKKKIHPILVLCILATVAGSAFFVVQGVGMHEEAIEEEAQFHALQAEYYSQGKEIRDAAPIGSELNQKLAAIQNAPSELTRLELVGIGKILVGLGTLLLGILIAILTLPGRVKDAIGERE